MLALRLPSIGPLKNKIIEGFRQHGNDIGVRLGFPNVTNITIHTYYHTRQSHHTSARREPLIAELRRLGEMREALNLLVYWSKLDQLLRQKLRK